MPRRFFALLFSVFLAASGATGVVLHVCQSMGSVAVGGCDCEMPQEHASHSSHGSHGTHAAHDAAHKLEAQPCCTIEMVDALPLLGTHEASTLQVDDAMVAVAGSRDAIVARSRIVCDLALLRERAPPSVHGPPLFIRNCSFLN